MIEFVDYLLNQELLYFALTSLISIALSVAASKLAFKNDMLKHRESILISNEEEQKKQLRQLISENKMSVLNLSRKLNRRIVMLQVNRGRGWLSRDDEYCFSTTLYLLLDFFSSVAKIEEIADKIDTSIISNDDAEFLQYLKLFRAFLCDAYFIKALETDYDVECGEKHIRSFDFEYMLLAFRKFSNYYDFKNAYLLKEEIFERDFAPLLTFLSELEMYEENSKAQILQALQYVIISFINTYGYPKWKLSDRELKGLAASAYSLKRLNNVFSQVIAKNKMDGQTELKRLMNIIREIESGAESIQDIQRENGYDPYSMM